MTIEKIDQIALLCEKTKDPKYKTLWYQYVKEFANGTYYPERWNVSSSTSNKTDDRRNNITRSTSGKLL